MSSLANQTPQNADDYARARSKAINAAMSALRQNHVDEYQKRVVDEMAKRGFEWEPRMNRVDRAKQRIIDLATEHKLDLVELADLLSGIEHR